MSTETPLTDAEKRLLNRQVMDYALDRGMWANLIRTFQSILAARLDALRAENQRLRETVSIQAKEADTDRAEITTAHAERDALRDAVTTARTELQRLASDPGIHPRWEKVLLDTAGLLSEAGERP